MKNLVICIMLGIVFQCASSQPAAVKAPDEYISEWPMMQKDSRYNGISQAPAIKNPHIAWKAYIGIQGYVNNPVLVDRYVIVGSAGTTHNQPDSMDGLYCLTQDEGRRVWFFHTEQDACGVAYAANTLFLTSDDGNLYALDLLTGKLKWKRTIGGKLYCQPLVLDQLVCIGDAYGTILAYNRENGRRRWFIEAAKSPIRGGLASDGTYIYAAFVEGKVVCLDSLDRKGAFVWSRSLTRPSFSGKTQEPLEIYAAPTLYRGKVIVTFARDTYYKTPAVYALDMHNGKLLWKGSDGLQRNMYGNIRSSVAVWNSYLLYGAPYSNELVALDEASGQSSWSLNIGAFMFSHWPSPVIAGDTLYLARHDGGLYAVNLREKSLAWQAYPGDNDLSGNDLPDHIKSHKKDFPAGKKPIYATPAINSKGVVFV
jgi:outer membrane protein assembly factor BamB